MPLFECTQCHCVENTALGEYWWRKYKDMPVICSECGKGKWHGKFPKESAKGMLVDQNGHLWTPEQQAANQMPTGYRIVGKVE